MRIWLKTVLVILLLSVVQAAFSKNVKLNNFRFAAEPDKTRIVFNVSEPVEYEAIDFPDKIIVDIKNTSLASKLQSTEFSKTQVISITSIPTKNDLRLIIKLKEPIKLEQFTLKSPDRLVLDLHPLNPVIKKQKKVIDTPVVTAAAQPSNIEANTKTQKENDEDALEKLVSNVIEKEKIDTKVESGAGTIIATTDIESSKILASFSNKKREETLTEEQVEDQQQEEQEAIPIYHSTSDHRQDGNREIVIVIDPGHGGKDPGAIGKRGTREKDVTLAVAKRLKKEIDRIKGFKGVLTRSGDYYVPLRQRLNIAHKYRADMFISVHADAYKYDHACGASVFALSQRGATSEAARWIAEKENESELGQAISHKNYMLRSVLIDLAQTATISSSLEMGKIIIRNLADIGRLHQNYVEQAGFVVLKSPDIPSLLVEIGFLSNGSEEKKLRTHKYQMALADKLASGVKSYFMRRPPYGTYLAKAR